MMKTLYRLQLRLLASRGRILAIGALGLFGILLAIPVSSSDDPTSAAFSFISSFGLAGLIPISALVIASASLGDPAEDGTLVHFWLRPVPRFQIAFSAWLAALTLAIPLSVVPVTIAAMVCGVGSTFVVGVALSSLLGSMAYAALFVAFGLQVQRALAWGLAYVLLWEGAIANSGAGLNRLAIRGYTRSVLRAFTGDGPVLQYPVGRPVAIIVLLVVSVLGLAWGTRVVSRTNVA